MTSLVDCDPKRCHRTNCVNYGRLPFVELWSSARICR